VPPASQIGERAVEILAGGPTAFISYIDAGRISGSIRKLKHYGEIVARAAAALATICGGSGI